MDDQFGRALRIGFAGVLVVPIALALGWKILAPQVQISGWFWTALILAALLWPLLRIQVPSAGRRRS